MTKRVQETEKRIDKYWNIYDGVPPRDTMGLIGYLYGTIKIPNFRDLEKYYANIHVPYTKKTLPNLREVDGCHNCKFGVTEFCGSHCETDCGLTQDYMGENKICDLYEKD